MDGNVLGSGNRAASTLPVIARAPVAACSAISLLSPQRRSNDIVMTETVHAIEREVRALSPQYREVTVRRERGCKSSRRNVAALYVACAPLHLSSGFQVPAPIAACVQRSQIPFGGEAQSIRG